MILLSGLQLPKHCLIVNVNVKRYGVDMHKVALAVLLSATPIFASTDRVGKVIGALIQVESRGVSDARNGNAVGVLQIKPIMVREVNRILRKDVYKPEDRLDKQKSIDMAGIFYAYWIPRWPKMSDRELAGRWMLPNGKAPEWYKKRIDKELK